MANADGNELLLMMDNIEKDLCHQYSSFCKCVFYYHFFAVAAVVVVVVGVVGKMSFGADDDVVVG